jgi:hypothetical protein
LWQQPVFGQARPKGETRISSSAFYDDVRDQADEQTEVSWRRPVLKGGVLSGVAVTTRTGSLFHSGKNVVEFRNLSKGKETVSVQVGAFALNPMRVPNRSGTVALPSVLIRGVKTEFATPLATVGVFTGRYTIEEGARLLSARSLPARITGVYLTRSPLKNLMASIEVDRIGRNGFEAETRLRQSLRWTPFKGLAGIAEYGVMAHGRPSFHASVERDGARVGLTAAYVERAPDYLSFGPLAGVSNRRGASADGRTRLTKWLELTGNFSDLQPWAPRLTTVTHARQYSTNAAVTLPAKIQLGVSHSASGAVSPTFAWWQTADSISISGTYRRFSNRLRLESVRAGGTTRVWAVELEEGRGFKHGFSLSGRARWQTSSDPAKHIGRLSTGVRGSFSVGKRLTFAASTDLSGEFRNPTWLTTSSQRNVAVSSTVKLTPMLNVQFEYGTAQQFYSPYLGPTVVAGHQRTFFVRMQRTM